MCDKYNIKIGLTTGIEKFLFGKPFFSDKDYLKICRDNNRECKKYREIQTKNNTLGYCALNE